jgi:hypothetical protein
VSIASARGPLVFAQPAVKRVLGRNGSGTRKLRGQTFGVAIASATRRQIGQQHSSTDTML